MPSAVCSTQLYEKPEMFHSSQLVESVKTWEGFASTDKIQMSGGSCLPGNQVVQEPLEIVKALVVVRVTAFASMPGTVRAEGNLRSSGIIEPCLSEWFQRRLLMYLTTDEQ